MKKELLSAKGALILIKCRPPSRPDRQNCEITLRYEGKLVMKQATTGRTAVHRGSNETCLLYAIVAFEDEDRGATFAGPPGDRLCAPSLPAEDIASMYGGHIGYEYTFRHAGKRPTQQKH